MSTAHKPILRLFAPVFLTLFVGLMILGWGDWRTFWEHPARTGLVMCFVCGALVVALFGRTSGFSGGKREDVKQRLFILAILPMTVLLIYLPAYADRHNWLVLNSDAVRYVGLFVFIVGATVRGIAVFTLGYRFSGLIAIQEGHTLITHGVFRTLRHPSYLGGLMAMTGWMLVFRSLFGLLFVPLMFALFVWRMNAEERLLASEFGEEYEAYKRRTWRLVPYVY